MKRMKRKHRSQRVYHVRRKLAIRTMPSMVDIYSDAIEYMHANGYPRKDLAMADFDAVFGVPQSVIDGT